MLFIAQQTKIFTFKSSVHKEQSGTKVTFSCFCADLLCTIGIFLFAFYRKHNIRISFSFIPSSPHFPAALLSFYSFMLFEPSPYLTQTETHTGFLYSGLNPGMLRTESQQQHGRRKTAGDRKPQENQNYEKHKRRFRTRQ
ncbi:hypothetical protein GOODEAATRI_024852 [Goodea atripinnis]|uniref:Uncharacterized protein n=1 Tax=Goodea atripinnis TaxID=208336 RepID=A0ABV0P7M7_9TELE